MTNDGATILRAVGVDNPAAKVLVEMSRVQDSEVGDGTTSVTVLASELIREAEKLVDMRIHPQVRTKQRTVLLSSIRTLYLYINCQSKIKALYWNH